MIVRKYNGVSHTEMLKLVRAVKGPHFARLNAAVEVIESPIRKFHKSHNKFYPSEQYDITLTYENPKC